MPRLVVRNSFYEISIDQLKKRLYLKVIGFWPDLETVPDYLKDIKKAQFHSAKEAEDWLN